MQVLPWNIIFYGATLQDLKDIIFIHGLLSYNKLQKVWDTTTKNRPFFLYFAASQAV